MTVLLTRLYKYRPPFKVCYAIADVYFQGLTAYRARLAGLSTARLPISRYMEFSSSLPHHVNLPINIGQPSIYIILHPTIQFPLSLVTHTPTPTPTHPHPPSLFSLPHPLQCLTCYWTSTVAETGAQSSTLTCQLGKVSGSNHNPQIYSSTVMHITFAST